MPLKPRTIDILESAKQENPEPDPVSPPLEKKKMEEKPIEGIHHAHGTPPTAADTPKRPHKGHGISHAHGTPPVPEDLPERPAEGYGINHGHGTWPLKPGA